MQIDVQVPADFESHTTAPVIPIMDIARVFSDKYKIKKPDAQKKLSFGTFAWVPASKCYINFEEQRHPEDNHILKIHKNYDAQLCTPLNAVYYPKTGRYHISDGQQHSIATLLQYDLDVADPMLPVWFVEGDQKTERKLVLGLNRDNLPMNKFFLHKAEVKDGNVTAVKIQRMCEQVGVYPSHKNKKRVTCITHISNLYTCYKKLGESNTRDALEILTQAFPGQRINTLAMLGLAAVFKQLKQENKYSKELAEDIGIALRAAFENMHAIYVDINRWFDTLITNQTIPKYAVENIGKYSSGIVKTYQRVTGIKVIEPTHDAVDPKFILSGVKNLYKQHGGVNA